MNPELAELLNDFVAEAEERVARIESVLVTLAEASPTRRRAGLEELRRELHTLKGNSGMMGFDEMQGLAHSMEDHLQELDPSRPDVAPLLDDLDCFRELLGGAGGETADDDSERSPESSIRVPLSHLDELVALSAELVVARNRLQEATAAGLLGAESDPAARDLWRRADESRRGLDKLLDAAQRRIERLRMVPLRKIFSRLQRILHDEGNLSGKEVRLRTRGDETPIDNSLVEIAGEVLGHLVRNAVIHGIEAPAARREAGKPATGTILLAASVRARSVVIEVVDDGGGIDRRALLRAAAKAGLTIPDEMALEELIFHPGLSSRAAANRSAGRGMGLAAVSASARSCGGSLEVESRPGIGTRISVHLPLAVAVTEALLVEAGGEEYALPASAVLETVAIEASDWAQGFVEIGDRNLPLIDLAASFDPRSTRRQGRYGVVLEAEGRERSLVVEKLGDLREVVVHRLDDALASVPGISGTTIVGDGRVVLILDPSVLTAMEEAA